MSAAAAWPCPALGAAGSGADALAVPGCAPAHSVSSPVPQLSFRSSVPYGGESRSQLMIKGQGFWLCQQTEVTDCTVTVRVTWTCVPRPAPVGNSSLLGGLDVRGLLIFP